MPVLAFGKSQVIMKKTFQKEIFYVYRNANVILISFSLQSVKDTSNY